MTPREASQSVRRPIGPIFVLGVLGMLGPLGCAHAPASAARPSPPRVELLTVGDHAVSVEGLRFAYHVRGKGPLCLVHPGGPGLTWTYLRMPKLEERLTLLYLEPIGSGSSGRLPAGQVYGYKRFAQLLDGLRKGLGLDSFCLIGHGQGGIVAQQYVLEHGDRIWALVLYDTLSRADARLSESVIHNLLWFHREPWYASARKAWLSSSSPRDDEEATRRWAQALPLYFADYQAHRAAYEPVAKVACSASPIRQVPPPARLDFRPFYSLVRAPTLVVVGKRDFFMPEPFAREIAEGIGGARLVVLPRSGHMGHLEEPDAFARAVADFVEKQPRP